MAYNFAPGKYAQVIVGSTTIACQDGWSLSIAGDDEDITHSGSSGVKQFLNVNDLITGKIGGVWDLDVQPTDRPPALYRGEAVTLKLYISLEAYFTVPARIKTFDAVGEINGAIKWTATFQATSAITMPGATAYSSSSSASSSSTS